MGRIIPYIMEKKMFQTTNQEFVSNYPQLLSPMFDREFPICLVKNLYL